MEQAKIDEACAAIEDACAELTGMIRAKGFPHGRASYFSTLKTRWRIERDQNAFTGAIWVDSYADALRVVDHMVARTVIEAQREAIALKLNSSDPETLAKIADAMGLRVEAA